MSCIILASHFEELRYVLRVTSVVFDFIPLWNPKYGIENQLICPQIPSKIPNQNKTQAGKSEFPEILLTFEV